MQPCSHNKSYVSNKLNQNSIAPGSRESRFSLVRTRDCMVIMPSPESCYEPPRCRYCIRRSHSNTADVSDPSELPSVGLERVL